MNSIDESDIPLNFLFLQDIKESARALLQYQWKSTMTELLVKWQAHKQGTKDLRISPEIEPTDLVEGNREPWHSHTFWSLLYYGYPEIAFYCKGLYCVTYLRDGLSFMIRNPALVVRALDLYDDES